MSIYVTSDNLYFDKFSIPNLQNDPEIVTKHVHSFYEVIFFVGGEANYVVEGKRYKLRKNDLVFTRPSTYHYIELLSNATYTRYLFTFEPKTDLDKALVNSIPAHLDVVNFHEQSIVNENFKRIDYYASRLSNEAFSDVLYGLLKEILHNLALTETDIITIPSELSPILTRALEYVNDNLFTLSDVDELARAMSLSPPYLFKIFKQQLKISPKQYVILKRLQYAQTMIRRGKKPTEIYLDCGFQSYVGFYKHFLKTFGYPPSQEKPQP